MESGAGLEHIRLGKGYRFHRGEMNEEKATPPPWWRYAKKQVPNESVVSEFPSSGSNNSLQELYRKRIPGWTRLEGQAGYTKKYEIAHMTPPLRYHDARHYEVIQTGVILRDFEFEMTAQSSKSFNGKYEFNFEPLMRTG